MTVIEQLGGLLINTSVEKRELGVLVLTEVLKSLPTSFLNLQQCEVISTFFVDKLKDHHQVNEIYIFFCFLYFLSVFLIQGFWIKAY